MSSSRRGWLVLVIWLAALGIALYFDRSVAEWVRRANPLEKSSWIARVLKSPGHFGFTIAVAALLVMFHRRAWHAAAALLLAAGFQGIFYSVIKWAVGRHRPVPEFGIAPFSFRPFANGLHGLLTAEHGLSFPSGHAALAFATAGCLAALMPRFAALCYMLAGVVAVERVLESAHYLSDVIAGAALGVCCARLALRLVPTHAVCREPLMAAQQPQGQQEQERVEQ